MSSGISMKLSEIRFSNTYWIKTLFEKESSKAPIYIYLKSGAFKRLLQEWIAFFRRVFSKGNFEIEKFS